MTTGYHYKKVLRITIIWIDERYCVENQTGCWPQTFDVDLPVMAKGFLHARAELTKKRVKEVKP